MKISKEVADSIQELKGVLMQFTRETGVILEGDKLLFFVAGYNMALKQVKLEMEKLKKD